MMGNHTCESPEETFELGIGIGHELRKGDVVLLFGGLGAGKTLLTKGILAALGFDVDEVTSPSFSLVNLYRTPIFDVYHIDLWRLDPKSDAVSAVGLDEILEDGRSVAIIEWADRLGESSLFADAINVHIEGDGDEPRMIDIKSVSVARK